MEVSLRGQTADGQQSEPGQVPGPGPEERKRAVARLRSSSGALYLFSLVGFLVLWQLVIWVFGIKEYTLPGPYAVAEGIVDNADLLLTNSWVTLVEIMTAFILSVLISMPIAAGIAFSRVIDKILYPILVAGQSVPKVAIAPVMVLWFGFGFKSNIAISVSIAIFPMVINTALGLKSIDRDMIRLGRAMGGSPKRVLWRIRLPNALPNIFVGLKLGMTFAVIGAIIGEFISGSEGLGYVIQFATGQLRTVLAFAGIVVLSILGMILYYIIEAIERLCIPWHSSQTPTS